MKLTVFVAVTFLLSTGAIALAQTPAGTKIVPFRHTLKDANSEAVQ